MFHFRKKQKNFLECWDGFKRLFHECNIMLFLDFDGTLATIAEQPKEALLPPEIKALLHILSQGNSVALTIVTGRSLEDIRHKIGIKKIAYIANHGFEIEGINVHFRNPLFPKTTQIYREIEKELREAFKEIPEILFEDKGSTLSVHYRIAPEKNKDFIKRTIRQVVKPYIRLREVSLREGKEVLEVRPAIAWDKGKAVLWLLRSSKELSSQKSVTIYIGDDDTDEDAFKALLGQAMTIRVGESKTSAAQYYLNDVKQVHEVLRRIVDLKR